MFNIVIVWRKVFCVMTLPVLGARRKARQMSLQSVLGQTTVSSSDLHERMQDHFACICLAFLHCVLRHDSSCPRYSTNVSAGSSRSNTAPYVRPQSCQSQHQDAPIYPILWNFLSRNTLQCCVGERKCV